MTDSRFFKRAGPFLLGEIAEVIGGELPDAASAAVPIFDLAPLDTAQEKEISVFTGGRYRDAFLATKAAAVVTAPNLACRDDEAGLLVYVERPRLAFARIGRLFYPNDVVEPGIDPTARIHPSAEIGEDARIESGAVVGAGAEIGARCHIAHNAVIGPGVILGDDASVGANSCVSHAILGHSVRIASCVTIGSEGFGFIPGPNGPFRMLQLGRVLIEDEVEIGANCAIDRGATGDTVIGRGSVLDNLVQIGHNVSLGRYCVISGQAGIAGSTVVGDGVMIGGQAAVSDHLRIGDGARIAGKSGVMRDVSPGETVAGYPAVAVRQWHRQTASISRLVARGRNGTD
jgi:UDP-3-O-[3-hydroxymyristoyl] glucosamine N-acyltransferase